MAVSWNFRQTSTDSVVMDVKCILFAVKMHNLTVIFHTLRRMYVLEVLTVYKSGQLFFLFFSGKPTSFLPRRKFVKETFLVGIFFTAKITKSA
jgi:hypothetical protein